MADPSDSPFLLIRPLRTSSDRMKIERFQGIAVSKLQVFDQKSKINSIAQIHCAHVVELCDQFKSNQSKAYESH